MFVLLVTDKRANSRIEEMTMNLVRSQCSPRHVSFENFCSATELHSSTSPAANPKKKTCFSTSAKWLIIDSGVSESQALAVSHSDILFFGRSERDPPGGIISASCLLQVSRDEKKLYTDRRANTIKVRRDRRQSRCFSFLSARNKTLITGKPTKYSLFLAHF